MADADLTNLEEARLLHAADAVQKGYRKRCLRTVDTDVVVLAIAMFHQINPDELWLAFGTASNFRYIPCDMDSITCAALHAFTGCDTLSASGGRDKKRAWSTWQVIPEVTESFENLLLREEEISETLMSVLERCGVALRLH